MNATEDIKLSYFLATIRQDVPISLDLEAMKCKEPDAETLAKLFDELEFKTLTNKFLGKAEKTKKKSQRQLDLFAEITPDGQEETKTSSMKALKQRSTNTISLIMWTMRLFYMIFYGQKKFFV